MIVIDYGLMIIIFPILPVIVGPYMLCLCMLFVWLWYSVVYVWVCSNASEWRRQRVHSVLRTLSYSIMFTWKRTYHWTWTLPLLLGYLNPKLLFHLSLPRTYSVVICNHASFLHLWWHFIPFLILAEQALLVIWPSWSHNYNFKTCISYRNIKVTA